MSTLALTRWPTLGRTLFPGLMACGVVAAAATFLSEHYGAPVMLFALLLGLAMNFLSAEGNSCGPGIGFTARELLRVGVALLGLRVTISQVVQLGWQPLAIVLISVVLTITLSMVVAKLLGFQAIFGLLTGGATAICGASAALALSAALPAHPQKERATLFTVIGISSLSTLAMIAYPMIVRALGLDEHAAGVFLGGTIHDVAQVVGAGYSLSRETGDVATLVKLLRVATLLPVILFASMLTRRRGDASAGPRPPLLPWFAVAFAILVAVNSTGLLPKAVQTLGTQMSGWCLVAAMAGIGMKTQLKDVITVGFRPVALMLGETVFLAALVLGLMKFL
ncbi:YeiH family protein [Pelomonas sp. KK5]|uniref:YeiH family protein n=1 Tax=Pelomonas sp. KK5 TaxID=1855730 RepID=UPI00097BC2A0|nr:putative sulfate exporter family transporter [Pelomonas sp. KK5]